MSARAHQSALSDPSHSEDVARPVLTTRQYSWLTAAFVVFIVYGSLVPLHFRSLPLDEGWSRLKEAFSQPVAVAQPSDWLANILLFIPLGFLLMGWRCVDRPGHSLAPILGIIPACSLLSAALEFAQLWFPPRNTNINDVVAETMGAIIGLSIWLLKGQAATEWTRRFWSRHASRNWSMRLIPPYLLVLVISHGLPFDLTLSPTQLKKKRQLGMVALIPFENTAQNPYETVDKIIVNVAWFLPAGALLAGIPFLYGKRSWPEVAGIGIALAACIELMQLSVLSRYFDATDIVTGTIAVWLGWRLMRSWQHTYLLLNSSLDGKRLIAAFLWVGALLFFHLEPFAFTADATILGERLRQTSAIPFEACLSLDYLNELNKLIQKALLFVPLGLFVSKHRGGRIERASVIVSALFLSFALAIGKLFCQPHALDVTDFVIEPLGAWLGYVAACRLSALMKAPFASRDSPSALVEQP